MRLPSSQGSSEIINMIRHWVIVARHEIKLFEALAAAFWHRRGFSVVFDRRTERLRRRVKRAVRGADRRAAPPLDLRSDRFCIVDANAGRSSELDDRFPR